MTPPLPRLRRLIAPALLFVVTTIHLRAAEVIPRGASWKYLKGRAEASSPDSAAWRQRGFDDAAWPSGATPLFYGEPLTGTELADMRGGYSSVYLRKRFTVSSLAELAELELEAQCDDGFIAWINGREVARYNVPDGPIPFNGLASGALAEPIPFESYVLAGPRDYLVAGENVLAIQAFNVSLADSSDFVFNASLRTVEDKTLPVAEEIVPTPGAVVRELNTVEVLFSEPVLGLEAADLLINGVPAASVDQFEPGDYVFRFPQPADGPVTVAWRANHGITDRLGAVHPFAGGSWGYTLETAGPAPGVFISEFLADNQRSVNDEDGSSEDWIELFNSGTTTASLKDWFLTDDPARLSKWRFPDVSIPAGGYLLVYASEKDRTNTTGRLHTNFKLSMDGEYLALVSPQTNVVSEFAPAYPPQFTDISYGRDPGDPRAEGYFTKPTPGALNVAGGPGFGPPVAFSRPAGNFLAPFDLTLSTDVKNAVIRYTLDGNMPTNGSPVYTGPIRISTSVEVRARSFQEGLLPGQPVSQTYLQLANNLTDFTSDLPVVIIHSLGKGSPTSSRQTFANISIHEPVNGVTSLTNPPTLMTRSGIKLRGSSTEGITKSSFRVEFWNEFNQDENHEVLGMPAESDWVLYAPNNFDPIMIHNPFIHRLSRDMGRYSPRTRFVEVYLNRATGPVATNHYNGIYVFEEKISIGPDRVNIDKLQPENLQPPAVTGGYLLKIDRLDPGDSGFNAGTSMAYVDPKEPEIELPQRDPQEQYIKKYFNDFNRALNSATWLDPATGYAAYIDVPSWVEFHVLEVLSGNVDSLVLSTYFHKPRNGKIVFGPHWDFDRALGSTDGRDANPRNWNTGPFFSAAWWPRLFRDPDFWQKWIDHYQTAQRTHLSRTNINRLIDELTAEISQAQPRETARWRTPFRGRSWQGEINHMKNWLSNRLDFINRQLAQPPVFSQEGGRIRAGQVLTLTTPPGGTIYYTLDGTDPRPPGGTAAVVARTYTGPITLTANARVVARTRNPAVRQSGGPPLSSPWSSPMAATFVVATPPLLLTELMFHPSPPPAGSTNSASDFEFLELKNVGNQPLDLPGFTLRGDVEFTFSGSGPITRLAPGERVLLVRNRAAFSARYGDASRVAGEFIGSLADSGGRLTLLGPLQEPVFDITFGEGWQPLADGFGFSLVLADETTAPEDVAVASRWRLSSRLGGSPGQPDPLPQRVAPVLVNEALPRAGANARDQIEFFNPGSLAVDISGWYLTDDYRDPGRFRMPPNSVVPPNGYLVIDENTFDPGRGPGFALGALGDDLYLFSASPSGELTGWVHGFPFGPSETGVSFGRHVDRAGGEHFVAQISPTFGRANSGPRVGPVVISEVLYHPTAPAGPGNPSYEFIELFNTSTEPISLFAPRAPRNTWQIRGAVRIDLPSVALPPRGFLVLVSFDPVADPIAAAAFRARFGLESATALFGPWEGALNNAGETIRLSRPDDTQTVVGPDTLDLPQILVESVAYRPTAPWPLVGAGDGLSLSRIGLDAFSDDPLNWNARVPTPGDFDTDADGLPDRWEQAHGLSVTGGTGANGPDGDPDGDGVSNAQELQAGTDPRNAASHLAMVAHVDAGRILRLRFSAVPGRPYTVLATESLSTPRWLPLRRFVPQAQPAVLEATDVLGTTTRYYRVQTP